VKTVMSTGAPDVSAHIDTEALRREHPIADVVAGYGIPLRRSGAALVGRCPFHEDRGRANLHVYRSGRWICYRCGERGDVIGFVQRVESLSFLEAVRRLTRDRHSRSSAPTPSPRRILSGPKQGRTEDELEVLAAATDFYASTLASHCDAQRYLAGRGFPPSVVEQYRIGFAAGGELASYLRWRRLPLRAAIRTGLLRKDGSEFLAGRITIPEFRSERPVWLIGRAVQTPGEAISTVPKYLGLPGSKPLLGWDEAARDTRGVCVVEGPLDLLALRMWGVPGVALAGTAPSPHNLALLAKFDRLYLALDQDTGGQEASQHLADELGARVVAIELPAGVKDVAELAQHDDGADLFRRAILRAVASRQHLTRAA
jgi:DNA primase